MTTLEAAEQFGQFSEQQVTRFLDEHGLTFDEAFKELGDSMFNAYELCLWLGY